MTSPVEITTPVQKLIDRIGSEYIHEVIPVKPVENASKVDSAKNVQQQIEKAGGSLVRGWAVWIGEFICEGVQHSVWEDADGNLVDVTPPPVEQEQILFVPDDREKAGIIRVSTIDNPLTAHLISLAEMRDYIKGLGERLDDEQIHFNTFTGNMYNHYDALFNNVGLFLSQGGKIGTNCYCGSMKPYSQCHGKNLIAVMEEDKKNVAKVNAA